MLALRLPEEIEQRLEKLAVTTGRTKSFYARQAIIVHMDELEEQYWEDSVVKDWENSKQSTVSATAFKSELGI
jgi:RHH-type rel operon transcriptional repressor/antitoxin RelB